jgi:integrase
LKGKAIGYVVVSLHGDGDRHIFTDHNSEPLDPEPVSNAFAAMVARHGIEAITLHDVRHSVASREANSGRPLHEVMELLGHSNIRTTLGYVHADDTGKREAARLRGEALWGTAERVPS